MNATEVRSFVAAYQEFVRTPLEAPRSEALFWTFDLWIDAAENDPELCWKLLLAVLAKNPDEQVIAALAAGPMEDLLTKHGADFIARAEEAAATNARFRQMLGGVWRNGIAQEIWDRVLKARTAA